MKRIDDPVKISIVITVCKNETYYSQDCLESIRKWKNTYHEVVVVSHDETPLLRAYLNSCKDDGLIDILIYGVHNHGHTKGFNLGVEHSTGDIVFCICNDLRLGSDIIDEVSLKLKENKQIGTIATIWYNESYKWKKDGKLEMIPLHPKIASREEILPDNILKILKSHPWYQGNFFDATYDGCYVFLCNTTFAGFRREVLDMFGGGFCKEFPHYWADNALGYSVIDNKMDVIRFDQKFLRSGQYQEMSYDFPPDKYPDGDKDYKWRDELKFNIDDFMIDYCDINKCELEKTEIDYLILKLIEVKDGDKIFIGEEKKYAELSVIFKHLKNKRVTFVSSGLSEFINNNKNIFQFIDFKNHTFIDYDDFSNKNFRFDCVIMFKIERLMDHNSLLKKVKKNGNIFIVEYNSKTSILHKQFSFIENHKNIYFYSTKTTRREEFVWKY